MENNTHDYVYEPNVIYAENADASRKFIANVFLWMFVALGISAGLAWIFANDQSLIGLLFNFETGSRTGLGTIVMFSPLAFILLMSFGINKLSYPILLILFIAYASLMGVSLSFIFHAYP